MYKLLPGQVITGRKSLAMDLGLSERKIRTSINKLISTNEVTVQTTNKFSIISICNWDAYQHIEQDQRPAERPATSPAKDQQAATYKKVKNIRSKEDIVVAAISSTAKRQKDFYNSLIPFLTEHPKERIKAFYDYWSELNPPKTKMRFELEKTWELKKRLATWVSRDKTNGKPSEKPQPRIYYNDDPELSPDEYYQKHGTWRSGDYMQYGIKPEYR